MLNTRDIDVVCDEGGRSQVVAASTTSAQTANAITADYVMITVPATCFVRMGSNPTALINGTDLALAAGTYRMAIKSGYKIAVILTTGTGNVYITPTV
jgi:hypothetical protein